MSERIELVMAQAVIQRIKADCDALTVQLAEAQAVIDLARRTDPEPGSARDEILTQSPTDALEAVKHAAWDEGYDSFKFNGHWVTNQSASVRKWVANPLPNPYRPTEPEADHA